MFRQVYHPGWIVIAITIVVFWISSSAIAEPIHDHSIHHSGGQTQEQSTHSVAFARGMEQSMAKMMADMHAAPATGNPDLDFLAMMIPHHQGAIDMARLVLLHGNDPLVRQLAAEVIATQQVEIATMQGRLAVLHHGVDPNPGGFPSLGGTRGAL